MINTAYNYKKVLSCNDIKQELSHISSNARRNPYIVLYQAAIILKEALQSSTGIETTPLNPYDITFEKAKDVVPNTATQFQQVHHQNFKYSSGLNICYIKWQNQNNKTCWASIVNEK